MRHVIGAVSTFFFLAACAAPSGGTLESRQGLTGAAEKSSMLSPQIRRISFETDEGTWMNVDVSPDGETIVFDLLGDIYLMPIDGGDAVPLTTGRAWDMGPRFSPDGAHVFFVSDRMEEKNLWRVSVADKSLRQITRLDRDIWGAVNWSQEGDQLLASIAAPDFWLSAETTLHYVDPASGVTTPVDPAAGPANDLNAGSFPKRLRPVKRVFSGAGGGAGEGSVFFAANKPVKNADEWSQTRIRLFKFESATKTEIQLTPDDAPYSEFKPQLSHNGAFLAYYRQHDDRRTELRVLDLSSRQDRLMTSLEDADDAQYTILDDYRPNYAFTPDDDALVFWHGGKIHRVSLVDGAVQIVPFRVKAEHDVAMRAEPRAPKIKAVEEANAIRWPSLSRDGQTLAFAAAGYIWVMDVSSGDIRRLTNSGEYEFMPSISPDGSSVAYVSFSSDWREYKEYQPGSDWLETGRLMIAHIDGATPQEVLHQPGAQFVHPAWSEDGTKIAVKRQSVVDNNWKNTVGWTTPSGGDFNEVMDLPARFTWGQARFLYSFWVGFDSAGEHILFSYPVSPEKTILSQADLSGVGFKTLAIGASDVGGISASPDMTKLALTRRGGGLWLAPFTLGPEPKAVSTLVPQASPVSENGGYNPVWRNDHQITYGFGTKFHRYNLQTKKRTALNINVPITRPVVDRPVAYVGARLITLSEEDNTPAVIENGVLLVERGRITAVDAERDVTLPADTLVVDVAGKTIAPGFIDTHYHNMGGTASHNLPNSIWSDVSAIEYGLTAAWDPGSKADDGGAAHDDLHRAGRVVGPRWSYTAGSIGQPYDLIAEDDARTLAAVARFKKSSVTTMKEYNARTRAQQQRLSAAARYHGLGIVSHLDGFATTMTRIVDGYTGGDHPYVPAPFYKDVQQLLAQTGFIWTPNIIITPSTISTSGFALDSAPIPTYFCGAVEEGREQGTIAGGKANALCENVTKNESLPSFDVHRAGRVARQTAIAAANGASIGVSAHDRPGYYLHMEMWALWMGGMPAMDVLRSTSLVNAEKIGLRNEIGSLEVGKVADFVVLDGNPLDNIIDTMSVRYTVQGGVIYDSETAERVEPSAIGLSVR